MPGAQNHNLPTPLPGAQTRHDVSPQTPNNGGSAEDWAQDGSTGGWPTEHRLTGGHPLARPKRVGCGASVQYSIAPRTPNNGGSAKDWAQDGSTRSTREDYHPSTRSLGADSQSPTHRRVHAGCLLKHQEAHEAYLIANPITWGAHRRGPVQPP